jgi:hypothetical protein
MLNKCDQIDQIEYMDIAVNSRNTVDPTGAPEMRLIMDSSDQFDLYEWALDFSEAAGFEVERVAPKYPN